MRRRDLSKLVSLPPLSPSEAQLLRDLLDGCFEALAERATPAEHSLIIGLIAGIDLQLRMLAWPSPAEKKAPYPV